MDIGRGSRGVSGHGVCSNPYYLYYIEVDGKEVYTSENQRDVDMFEAELRARIGDNTEIERLRKAHEIMWDFIDLIAVGYDAMMSTDAKEIMKKVEALKDN